jgi:hypothetical protein
MTQVEPDVQYSQFPRLGRQKSRPPHPLALSWPRPPIGVLRRRLAVMRDRSPEALVFHSREGAADDGERSTPTL